MTVAEKKAYLQGYGSSVMKIKRCAVYLDELKELKENAYSLKKLTLTHQEELNRHIGQLEQFENNIRKSKNEQQGMCENIAISIETLENETEKVLLLYRYVKGLSWEEIAEKLEYSTTNVHRIHKKSLEHLKIKEFS